ncbi:MAG: class I SAM-dependent methyltransferase [Leptolyngbyaceae cyanobacterium SL_7_1]|nr:class I SAM-dependent methyltransferase [Leptolyngbyaceae cyanobacterium SL_7_1]
MANPTFKDHFSDHAQNYAKYRPGYPTVLFDYLATLVERPEVAWDCATGNGQAALGLAAHFPTVYATDASAEQIAHAFPHERIHYRVASAESSGLANCSVDLVTVGLALHWFDRERFYQEVQRVVKPGGRSRSGVQGDFSCLGQLPRSTKR